MFEINKLLPHKDRNCIQVVLVHFISSSTYLRWFSFFRGGACILKSILLYWWWGIGRLWRMFRQWDTDTAANTGLHGNPDGGSSWSPTWHSGWKYRYTLTATMYGDDELSGSVSRVMDCFVKKYFLGLRPCCVIWVVVYRYMWMDGIRNASRAACKEKMCALG